MRVPRRDILHAGLDLSLSLLPISSTVAGTGGPRFRAVAFDAFPIFDPRPVGALTEALFPNRGEALATAWRVRQFEYAWLRTIEGRYSDFMSVTADALVFAAKMLKLDLSAEHRDRLLGAYLQLKPWPDVLPALRRLEEAGVALCLLSNFTPDMLRGCIKSAGLQGVFRHVLSSDASRTYKPDPQAYQLGVDALKLPREEILFVPFAGWDAAGAKSFGYPTFWVNRLRLPPEELGDLPDASGGGLADLVAFIGL